MNLSQRWQIHLKLRQGRTIVAHCAKGPSFNIAPRGNDSKEHHEKRDVALKNVMLDAVVFTHTYPNQIINLLVRPRFRGRYR